MILRNKKMYGEEKNHFNRLPDELLLSILSRVCDLKSLCRCSLVSKSFESAIYFIESVSVTLPSKEPYSYASAQNIFLLLHLMLKSDGEKITRLVQSSSFQVLEFILFLQKFRQLKSIHVEFKCPRGPLLGRWKAKLGSSGPVVESLVSLSATSLSKNRENHRENQENQETPCPITVSHIQNNGFIRSLHEQLIVLCMLVKCQPSLRSVTVTDSEKRGNLSLREEQLFEWRKKLLDGNLSDFVLVDSRVGWIPELHLPSSGYLMKGVFVEFFRFVPCLRTSGGYDDALNWEYEGEEELLREAVGEILKNHREGVAADLNHFYESFLPNGMKLLLWCLEFTNQNGLD